MQTSRTALPERRQRLAVLDNVEHVAVTQRIGPGNSLTRA